MPLYDTIGSGYDLTRRADPYIVERLIRLLDVRPQEKFLDVACGTGNYALAIAAEVNGHAYGIDHSARMIESGKKKGDSVVWCIGAAESLPFRSETFSGVTCTLAIHHFKSMRRPFEEIFRVLANGRFVLFTATSEQMEYYWLTEYFPGAMRKSIRQMPTYGRIVRNLKCAGFRNVHEEKYDVSSQLQDLFLYSGKHRPEIYLNRRVRSGISTFANLADSSEIDDGCKRLCRDIRSGWIRKVMSAYTHDGGDYLFLVAEK